MLSLNKLAFPASYRVPYAHITKEQERGVKMAELLKCLLHTRGDLSLSSEPRLRLVEWVEGTLVLIPLFLGTLVWFQHPHQVIHKHLQLQLQRI